MATSDAPRPGPIPILRSPLGAPLAALYRAAVARRNAGFDRGRRVTRLPVPVVSVGNISLGGTGKTPMVAHLVRTLRTSGHTPAIAMRGYGARPGETSDEQREYASLVPDTPIVAQPDRAAGALALLRSRSDVDCVVLDDGFQHRFVARDVDIVLVDASRDPFRDRCLPRGWLREPVENLARADAVVVTHAERASPASLAALESRLAKSHGRPPIAVCRHAWTGFATGDGPRSIESLRGSRVLALCGVGNPDAFFDQAAEAGAVLTGRIALADHARYDAKLVSRLSRAAAESGADFVLTTRKDWVKIQPYTVGGALPGGAPVWRASLSLRFDRGEDDLRRLVLSAVAAGAGEREGVAGGTLPAR